MSGECGYSVQIHEAFLLVADAEVNEALLLVGAGRSPAMDRLISGLWFGSTGNGLVVCVCVCERESEAVDH